PTFGHQHLRNGSEAPAVRRSTWPSRSSRRLFTAPEKCGVRLDRLAGSLWDVVFVEDGLHCALLDACRAADAGARMDVELERRAARLPPVAGNDFDFGDGDRTVDAVDRANRDARGVARTNAGICDDVGHAPSLSTA